MLFGFVRSFHTAVAGAKRKSGKPEEAKKEKSIDLFGGWMTSSYGWHRRIFCDVNLFHQNLDLKQRMDVVA